MLETFCRVPEHAPERRPENSRGGKARHENPLAKFEGLPHLEVFVRPTPPTHLAPLRAAIKTLTPPHNLPISSPLFFVGIPDSSNHLPHSSA